MRNLGITLILVTSLGTAMAAEPAAPAPTAAEARPPSAAPAAAPAAAPEATPAPSEAPPSQVPALPSAPPAPPSLSDNPPPPQAAAGPPPAGAPVAPGPGPTGPPPAQGQWVSTNQYGWIWVPYARNYTYVDPAGELAFTYAYYPAFGWRWLASPWVLGWGPTPYWGRLGAGYYAWYAHPWFHHGVYRPTVWTHYGRFYGRPVAAPGPRAIYRGRGGGFGGGRHR